MHLRARAPFLDHRGETLQKQGHHSRVEILSDGERLLAHLVLLDGLLTRFALRLGSVCDKGSGCDKGSACDKGR